VEEDVAGDHARALAPRGLADAQALADWLHAQALHPDAALCSSATRTRQTLAAIAPNVPTVLSDKLYLASVGEMLTQIQATDDAVETLLLVCHNPGAHGLLAQLVGSYADEADADKLLLKFPTSACAVMEFNVAQWREVAAGGAHLLQLRY
jgi:phosphohistidine phosphatase